MQGRSLLLAILAAAVCAPAASAQALLPIDRLPRTQELAYIRTAAPDSVVARATIWALGDAGYEKVQEGTNGFGCLIQYGVDGRHMMPRCDDPSGVKAIYPPFFLLEEMRAKGLPRQAYLDSLNVGFARGRFQAPQMGGFSYMYSTDAWFTLANGERAPFTPHIMIYWPYCTMEQLGALVPADLRGSGISLLGRGAPDCHLIVNTPPSTARTVSATP